MTNTKHFKRLKTRNIYIAKRPQKIYLLEKKNESNFDLSLPFTISFKHRLNSYTITTELTI